MHGPMAMKMLSFLCGDDKVKINESIKASEDALRARIALWDGIEKKILNNQKYTIHQFPMTISGRSYGSTKMELKHAVRSFFMMFRLFVKIKI